MRITCGTDFSERGHQAAEVAALLAARSGGRLELVHALDTRGAVLGAAHVLETLETAARERLDFEAGRLRALGATVDTAMPDGWPDEALLGEADRHDSAMIVLAATGSRDGAGVSVGKTCERTLSRAKRPMMVVRDAAPLTAWLRGERPLHILVAFDFSPQAASALAFAARLARIGACRIVAAFADDPRREARRMGLAGSPDEAQGLLQQALADHVAQLEPELPADVVVSPHLGDPAARLAHLAERENADLVVAGTHQRGPLQRLFAGSVSLQLLRDSATNLIIVPTAEAEAAAPAAAPHEVRRVLAATDLSPNGNRAIAQALAIAPAGAEVRIVHVMSPNQMLEGAYGRPSYKEFEAEHAAERANRQQALEALLPRGAKAGQRTIVCEVVEHDLPARAIAEQAEHYDVDLVCVGTLGRTGLSAALLGSTAQEVLRHLRRPLLLVPPAER
ncbi:universal stress protein [Zeimonas sediminis]|uniref:universal stress protein n=1 Tax=Zeimonas sediminis TaxID=2944268 RepID=UPI002342C8D5|nr:universal stress protein [Zeimonas sediminis]